MKLELSDTEILLVLAILLESHGECLSCEDEEAVKDRKTLQELYNKILCQAQDNGTANLLKTIGTITN